MRGATAVRPPEKPWPSGSSSPARTAASEGRAMTSAVRQVRPDDHAEWLRMRCALWEDCPEGQQVKEMEENLSSDVDQVFVAERPEGGLCGFLEAATRSRANGCDSTPVGYIEGWYV